jgi:hypothetical protein
MYAQSFSYVQYGSLETSTSKHFRNGINFWSDREVKEAIRISRGYSEKLLWEMLVNRGESMVTATV